MNDGTRRRAVHERPSSLVRSGILNNEMYIGKLVWNRQRFIKDPDTGKRQARPNPESEWVIQDAPELRIVEDDLSNAVKGRRKTVKHATRDERDPTENHFRDRRRPKYLLSGLTKCGCRGGGYSMISAHLVLHPNMAHHYRVQVEELYAALQEDSEARRMVATDVLRSLVKEIVLTPDPVSGELQIEVHGDLAGILTIALERKKPAGGA